MTVVLPHVFATTAATPPPAASQLDDNFNALAAAINAITITQGVTINSQTGTSYSVVGADIAKYLIFTNPAAIAVSLPQNVGAFAAPWYADFSCLASSGGAVTITPGGGSTIDGSATLILQPRQSARVIAGPGIDYAVERGMMQFTRGFTSAPQTITSAGALTLAHGFSVQPRLDLLQVYLICITGENGYSSGDQVIVPNGIISDGTASRGALVFPDPTNLNVRFGTAAACFLGGNKTTGGIIGFTNANWNVVFEAWV